jgi:hypothetical protein
MFPRLSAVAAADRLPRAYLFHADRVVKHVVARVFRMFPCSPMRACANARPASGTRERVSEAAAM